MNPSIKIEIRRALEWLTFEYAKNPREMTKKGWRREVKQWKEMKNTEKHSAVCTVWIIHTKTIKNGDGESDYKAARDDFDSQIAVDENVNNGRLHIFQIWSWKVKERGVSERFVCYTAALADCNLLWKMHTFNDLFTANTLYSNWQKSTAILWYCEIFILTVFTLVQNGYHTNTELFSGPS